MSKINNSIIKENTLKKIKSKYILKQIFDNLKQNKSLNIIRYNKKLKQKLNKNLKDYIKEYLKIEIEIIPKENKYGKFINYNKNKESHIYFNDNKEEVKRKSFTKNDKVTKIKIIIEEKIKSLSKLFKGCRDIKKIK